jgi:serine/threonine protein kinase
MFGEDEQMQRNTLTKRGYTVIERVAKGGFGVVVVARSARHHRQMAIKVIEKSSDRGAMNCALQWSVNNEKQFADLFDHPYINAYHEIIETTKR